LSETPEVKKPRRKAPPGHRKIVKLGPLPPLNGELGVQIMLGCGHVMKMYGTNIETYNGGLVCARCSPEVKCAWCGEPILPSEDVVECGDRDKSHGFYHAECEVRDFHGPASHFLKECPCFGGTRSDPPGMSKRDSARLALQAKQEVAQSRGEERRAMVASALREAIRKGKVIDLGTFHVNDDGTIEKADDDDDEDEVDAK
jgi:hypothetical protein